MLDFLLGIVTASGEEICVWFTLPVTTKLSCQGFFYCLWKKDPVSGD